MERFVFELLCPNKEHPRAVEKTDTPKNVESLHAAQRHKDRITPICDSYQWADTVQKEGLLSGNNVFAVTNGTVQTCHDNAYGMARHTARYTQFTRVTTVRYICESRAEMYGKRCSTSSHFLRWSRYIVQYRNKLDTAKIKQEQK